MNNLFKNRRLIIVSAIIFIFWIFIGSYFIYLGYQTNVLTKENNRLLKHLESSLIISFDDEERRIEFLEEIEDEDYSDNLNDYENIKDDQVSMII